MTAAASTMARASVERGTATDRRHRADGRREAASSASKRRRAQSRAQCRCAGVARRRSQVDSARGAAPRSRTAGQFLREERTGASEFSGGSAKLDGKESATSGASKRYGSEYRGGADLPNAGSTEKSSSSSVMVVGPLSIRTPKPFRLGELRASQPPIANHVCSPPITRSVTAM